MTMYKQNEIYAETFLLTYLVNAPMVHAPVYPIDTHVGKKQESSNAQEHPGPA